MAGSAAWAPTCTHKSRIRTHACATHRSVVAKVKDGATSAIKSLTKQREQPPAQQQQRGGWPAASRQQGECAEALVGAHAAHACMPAPTSGGAALLATNASDAAARAALMHAPAAERPLPLVPPLPGGGGGLLGGLVGGLVNAAARGLAESLERSAADSAAVAQRAADAIAGSRTVRQRLGDVSVGLPLSQSASSSSVNGVASKTISLLLPVYNSAGGVVSQAQVCAVLHDAACTCLPLVGLSRNTCWRPPCFCRWCTQVTHVEGPSGSSSCKIAVRVRHALCLLLARTPRLLHGCCISCSASA